MKKHYFAFGIVLFLCSTINAQLEYKDVAPIFFNRCTQCHHENQHAPSMLTYNQVLPLTFAIKHALQTGKMPPWSPDTLYSRFAHERAITQAEKDAIINWIDGGAIKGDTTLVPPIPTYSQYKLNGTPDLTLKIPTHTSTATSSDSYVCFSLPTGLTQNRVLRAFEIVPGNPEIVHHVIVNADTTGNTTSDLSGNCFNTPGDFGIGGYAPGSAPTVFPGQAPFKVGITLTAGTKIVLQIHYPAGSNGQVDSTQIRMYFYPPNETDIRPIYNSTPLQNWALYIPANQVVSFNDQYPGSGGGISAPMSIFSAFPHSHHICTEIINYAHLGTDTIPLIKINNWDFNWQGYYTFRNLVKIPQGYKLFSKHVFDNTTNNPFNPNSPPQTVFAGTATENEMLFDSFMWLEYQAGDELIDIASLLANDPLLTPPNSTGVANHTNTSLEAFVFPNPASGKVNITLSKSAKYKAAFKTLTGQQILLTDEFTDNISVDTHTIPNGIYLVEITDTDSNTKTTKKIVIAQ